MTNNEIRNTMNCLALMCKDLNDAHNNYDIPTGCEDSIREMLKEAINDFNKEQSVWHCELKPCIKGWCLRYE